MRFTGGVEDDAEAALVEGGDESVLQNDGKEADLNLEKEVLGIGGVEALGEVASGVLFEAGMGGLVGTVVDVGLGDMGFDLSKDGGESIGLLCVDGEEEDFLDSEEDVVLFCWEGAAGGLLETGEGEDPSRTGHDPWVVTAGGVEGKSFSIFPDEQILQDTRLKSS